MARMDNKTILIIIVGMVLVFAYFSNVELSGSLKLAGENAQRSLPSTVSPGEQFTVTYQAVSSGELAVIIEDEVNGGCTPTNTELVMIGNSPQTQSKTFTAPQSGTCTFSGTYQFADQAAQQFPTQSVSVQSCDTSCNGCGDFTRMYNDPQCSNSAFINCNNILRQLNIVTFDNGMCGCSTYADTDCSQCVGKLELLSYASKWLNNEITKLDLLEAASEWLSRDKSRC